MFNLRLIGWLVFVGCATPLWSEDVFYKGATELEVHRSEDGTMAYATFTRRVETEPPERLTTALAMTLEGENATYQGAGKLSVRVHFAAAEAEVTASGWPADGSFPEPFAPTRGTGRPEPIIGIYHRATGADRLAREKDRATKIDVELNRVYGELKGKLKPAQYDELRDAQREWIRYTYESGAMANDPGEDAGAWRSRADNAAERLQFLKHYTPGKAVERDPDLRTQLNAAIEAEAWAAAAEIGRRIIVVSNRDAEVREKRVRALLRLRDYERAEQALVDWEKSPAPKPALMDELRGELAEAQKKYEEAIRSWTAYLKNAPKDAETRGSLADVYLEQGNYAEAAKMREQQVKIEPTSDRLARLALASVLSRDWKRAGSAMRQAMASNATLDFAKNLFPRIERLEKAMGEVHAADQAVAAAPRNPMPLLDRGLLWIRLGWGELALEEAKAALALAPESRRALLQHGGALTMLGRQEERNKLGLRTVTDKFPVAPLLREIGVADLEVAAKPAEAQSAARRATLLNRAAQPLLALQDAEAALKVNAMLEEALVARGRALLKLDRAWEGLPDVVKATELNPKNPLGWLTRGEIELNHKDFPRATEALSKALELDDRNREALELRERCYRALGKASEAEIDAMRIKTL